MKSGSVTLYCLSLLYAVLGLAQPYDFNGIVKLSNCSGAVVKYADQSINSKALVLTNGHCIALPSMSNQILSFFGSDYLSADNGKEFFALTRYLGPGEVVYNAPVSRMMKVFTKQMDLVDVEAKKLLYATMTDTDLALYELSASYADLSLRGILPFTLSKVQPKKDTSIEIVSGYWDKGYRCQIEEIVYQLKEGDWTFTNSYRYSPTGCDTIGGTSGSPIIEKGKRLVVGVNNTNNEAGQKCTLNNPCEVDVNGRVLIVANRGYGQATHTLYSCLDSNYKLDLKISTCLLPKGKTISNTPSTFQGSRRL
jgi:V8-like Glu-specific endopeptidase